MSAKKIAARYAKALLDEAFRVDGLEYIHEDLKVVGRAIESSRDLQLLFKSPVIKSEKKQTIVKEIFGDKVTPTTRNFLSTVIEKGREEYLEDIIKAFEEAYNEFKEITKVQLITAIELPLQLEEKLLSTLKEQLGISNMVVSKEVDPEIIGGFIVKFGDKVLDNSVAHRLNVMERKILTR